MIINMGLIGVGKMGKYHLNLYDELPEINLQFLCDTDEALINSLSKSYKVPSGKDYHMFLDKVDAVTIASPTKFHYEIAKACLLAGKHVLIEKPITTNYSHALELFELALSKNLILHIGHVERFNGAVQELKNIVTDPKILHATRVGPFNPKFKNDSIVLDIMIHDIDIVLNAVKSKVKAVQATGSSVYSSIADYASVNICFEDGAVANIFASRVNQNKERFLKIVQKDSLVILDYTNQDINIIRQGLSEQILGNKELKYKNEFVQERLFIYKDNPLKLEIKHFINCIKGTDKRLVSLEHDLSSLKVALIVDELLNKSNFGQKEF